MTTLLIKLAVAASLAAAIGVGLWRLESAIEQRGYSRAEAEYTAKALVAAQDALAKEQGYLIQQTEAALAARKREKIIRADVANARSQLDSLRESIARARGLYSLTGTAIPATAIAADTGLDLLGECASRYQELAGQADGHVSDIKTMMGAWPK